jgi:hypothetical protein
MPRKKYRTKQTVIEEQAVEIEGLRQTIEGQYKDIDNLHKQFEEKEKRHENNLSWRTKQLHRESEKISDMIDPCMVITVFEEDYHTNSSKTVLSQTRIWQEDFHLDQQPLLEEAKKLRDSLSEFYQNHHSDVRITININSF